MRTLLRKTSTGRLEQDFIRQPAPAPSVNQAEPRTARKLHLLLGLAAAFAVCIASSSPASAVVGGIAVSAPRLSAQVAVNVTSPVHFEATAESDSPITGYVVYVDNQNVYRSFSPLLDAWVVLPPGGTHSVYIKAWDATGSLFRTPAYSINITGAAPPVPPPDATRIFPGVDPTHPWTVDNNLNVGGQCNDGSIGAFTNPSDPNTANSPDGSLQGQHFMLTSSCRYSDGLFFWKNSALPQSNHTNFLWDFWFYLPNNTFARGVQALEFDMFQSVRLSDGVHEFMFGSQCNYATNRLQIWLPKNSRLGWVDTNVTPCQFSNGSWHHMTYFMQRVTAGGYQQIPAAFSPTTDINSSVRFGTLTVDGQTVYLGGLAYSTMQPTWAQTMGVQHQLDSSITNVTIEEYIDKETITSW